jgi:phosphoribosylaminoimidazolecarboxamide formyltransferase/IMP cyclohydrolase
LTTRCTVGTRADVSRRALVSVSDKRGVVELAVVLKELGIEILSTGGTASALAAAGVAVTQVSAYTGAPEILDGRVKTLHPKIHGGLLGRDTGRTAGDGSERSPIDRRRELYPFESTIAKPGTTLEDAIGTSISVDRRCCGRPRRITARRGGRRSR